ncbi:MAG: ABC transporter ATP-binding protein [Spirochaetaceae bacterium]|nr:ABC transporter ATP-binding protein [Spirochaetaceae bacterium]
MNNNNILEIADLRVGFQLEEGLLKAVDGVDLSIKRKNVLGLIGESGCGKSMTANSILRILPGTGKIMGGKILFQRKDGSSIDIAGMRLDSKALRDIRGSEISMIFQEPMTSFSPVHTIGNQIIETVLLHSDKDKKSAREVAIGALEKVGMPNPDKSIDFYPHQLSGGLRQRAMIAMALSCDPGLLIADEPTTALDVTIQAQILELMKRLQEELGMAILYITHNLGVIAEISDEVAVMYLGMIVEQTSVNEIFRRPLHPYTEKLMKAIPKIGKTSKEKLVAIDGVVPIPLNLPVQCGFFPRCSKAIENRCDRSVPALKEIEEGHFVRCFLYQNEEEH